MSPRSSRSSEVPRLSDGFADKLRRRSAPAGALDRQRNRALQSRHHAGLSVPDFPRIQKVIRRLAAEKPGRCLDVGYAPGGFADSLRDLGWDCAALDLDAPDQAGVRVIRCDVSEGFPVPDEGFDLVTAGEILEHMIDEAAFLHDCRRVLKPGGLLVLTTPNLCYLPNRFLVLVGLPPRFVHAPYHYHFHTVATLRRLVADAGFVVDRLASSHVLYSRRLHSTGRLFEWLGDMLPTFGAHLILFARKPTLA